MARSWSKVKKPHRVLKVDSRGDYQKGEDVRALQSAANRRLKARGLDGYATSEDGSYGPDTRLACHKASWGLGALLSTLRRRSLSVGEQRMIRFPGLRTSGQLARAKSRLAELRRSRKGRDGAVRWAKSKVGVRENPAGSNGGGQISEWERQFGFGRVPWCGIFCGAALRHAGVKDVSSRIAAVAFIEDDARASRGPFRGWTTSTGSVRPGDLVVLFGRGVHVELVVSVVNGHVNTVGGNTSSGNAGSQSNGGGVFRRTRSLGDVRGFALVNY